jgi:APA family basic amino acid/polyamine antiporter
MAKIADPLAPSGLKPKLGIAAVVTMSAGAAMGPSIFAVLGPVAMVAGNLAPLAIALAATPTIFLGLIYSYLASVDPRSGASYEWPRRYLHPMVAFLISWSRILGNVGLLTVTGTVLVEYAGLSEIIPDKLSMLLVLFGVFVLNVLGIAEVARVQMLLMAIFLGAIALFLFAGAPLGDVGRLYPFNAPIGAAFLALPLLVNMFAGLEIATEIGEEVDRPERSIPLGIFVALVITLSTYMAVTVVTFALLGSSGVANSQTPLIDAALHTNFRFLPALIQFTAAMAILKSMNTLFLIFVRFIFAMGRSGVLPKQLAIIHPRFGTPHVAAAVCFLLSALGLLLPSGLIFLLTAASLPTLFKYGSVSICAFRLPTHFPEVHRRFAFNIRPGVIRFMSGLGVLSTLFIGALSIKTDYRGIVLLGGWIVVGVVYYYGRTRLFVSPSKPASVD